MMTLYRLVPARQMFKRILPRSLQWRLRRIRIRDDIRSERMRFRTKSVKETFSAIYQTNHWGGRNGQYNSGPGSAAEYAREYCARIGDFILAHQINSVADLGCGDFQVGSQIARPGLDYVGIDIVEELIRDNQAQYANARIRFQCLDIINDPLPAAELGLLRQVLQHLSNIEIAKVLENCRHYKFLIVTEHIPSGRVRRPNLDKPHGPDIRLFDDSGVFLDEPPFNRKVETLFETPVLDVGGVLRTVLIENAQAFAHIG